ncbi:MAG: 6-phosphogluconolactonase [Candidatus Levybacteria bacterium]|nr:6-phosphogluconolactonase [Candidatus Levybacteria bacterium]
MKVNVSSPHKGVIYAREWVYKNCDKSTLLLLSGGSTPKPLYETLAKEKKLNAGAVALVDERYGFPFHNQSNEKMIRDTGLFSFCTKQKIPVCKILHGKSIEQTAEDYNTQIIHLFSEFPKRIAILGIGSDGHIAGIAPQREDFHNPLFDADQNHLVGSFIDPKPMDKGGFGARVTITFAAIRKTTARLLLAFGENKKDALLKMRKIGPIEEIPARILMQKDITENTTILTDQRI